MLVFSVVFAVLLLQSPAQPQPAQEEQQQQPPRQPAAQGTPASNEPATPIISDIVSIDRIRKELERKPSLSFTMPDPNVPRYRVEIRAPHFNWPDFRESFKIPTSPVSQPLGGSDYYEMQRLNTPPQFWGSAPFTNGDLLKMSALTGAYGLAGALIRKGIEARHSAAEARAHQEVLQELADLADHNARVASGQVSDDADKKAADEKAKKKADAKKKKNEKKKQ